MPDFAESLHMSDLYSLMAATEPVLRDQEIFSYLATSSPGMLKWTRVTIPVPGKRCRVRTDLRKSQMHSHGPTVQPARLTKGCKKVLEILEKTEALSSAQDIHGQLRTEEPNAPGLTTVYRSLESLVGLGLVQAVDIGDGERRYEIVKPGEHHHHVICDNCRSSIHLDQCLVEDLEEAVRAKYGFEIRTHVLEIFGTCTDCQKKQSRR